MAIHGIELELGEWLTESVRSQLLSERYERGEARCLLRRVRASDVVMEIEDGELELVPAIDWDPIRAIIIELHPDVISPDGAHAIQARLRSEGLVKDRRVSSTNKLYMRRPDR